MKDTCGNYSNAAKHNGEYSTCMDELSYHLTIQTKRKSDCLYTIIEPFLLMDTVVNSCENENIWYCK